MLNNAKVTTGKTVIGPNGRGRTLPAGTYKVCHLDGVDEADIVEVYGAANGTLVCVSRHDPNIDFEGA